MIDNAIKPWQFDNLPGVNVNSWPENLDSLNEKLSSLEVLGLWNEPLDLKPEGKIFFKGAKSFIEDQISNESFSKEALSGSI